jgi:hypothetical protein
MVRVRAAALAESLEMRQLLTATILGRYTFYGDSAFDTSTTSVQAAIAPDKTALLPRQTATFANYTSYVKGVNGIAIDAANWPAAPVASDFILKAGNNAIPSTWTTITQAATFSIERGAGTGGSDRIVIRLPDNTYRNEWVQVTVNPTADTGLSSPDVFYFGNAVGDDGHGLTNAIVDSSNEAGARRDAHGFASSASLADLYDFNRDGSVNITDQLIARASVDTAATALQYFTAPTLADPGTTGSFSAVFNVKNYGATGNGTTDDTAALQAAINALSAARHGLLYLPSGTYRIDTLMYLQNLSNFEIRGTGATLMATSAEESVDIGGDLLRLDGCSNFTLSGLTFDGDSAQRAPSTYPSSLRLQGCTDFRVDACAFNNTVGDAIYVCALSPANDATASHDGLIEGCTINSAYRNGISFIHGSRVAIQSNLIQNVAGALPEDGIDIEANAGFDNDGANHDLTISNDRFQNIAGSGVGVIFAEDPYNVAIYSSQFSNVLTGVFNQGINSVVDNNVFNDVSTTQPVPATVGQIYCVSAVGQHVEISGNTFYSLNNVGAINVDQSWIGVPSISDNRCSGLTGTGFDALNVTGNGASIFGNVVSNCSSLPIAVVGLNVDVENNVVSGSTGDGITVSGSAMIIRDNAVSNCVIGLDLRDNPATGSTASPSIITGNTITNCDTGLMSSVIQSQITDNSFSNETTPASGPGSDAIAQIELLYVTAGSVLLSNNTLTTLNGETGIDIVNNWTGQATITGNQLLNILGSAISLAVTSVVTGNTVNCTGGVAIGIGGNYSDVENNTLTGSNPFGIYCTADGVTIRNNTISGQTTGIQLDDATAGIVAGAESTVDSNTITACPTGIYDATFNSAITHNHFTGATKPTSGPGSAAVAQLFVAGVTDGIALVSGNIFDTLSGLDAILFHASWSGTSTVTANQISNLLGSGVSAIGTAASNAVVRANTIQNSDGGIAASGTNIDIESNTLTNGPVTGIYEDGSNNIVRNNTLTDFGDVNTGKCIFTLFDSGGTIISGNTISKTVPNAAWIPIICWAQDQIGTNYAYNVGGLNGAFIPAPSTSGIPTLTLSDTTPPVDPTTPAIPKPRPHRVAFIAPPAAVTILPKLN